MGQLRLTLDALKEDAPTPESILADNPFRAAESIRAPTSTDSGRDVTSDRAGGSSVLGGRPGSTVPATDMTSVSEAMSLVSLDDSCDPIKVSSVDFEDEAPASYWSDLHELALGSKSEQLSALFPSLDAVTIQQSLDDAEDDFGRAIESLLNLVFIKQENEFASADETETAAPKGIDGFATSTRPARGRKAKRKKRKEQQQRSSRSSSGAPPSRDLSPDAPRRLRENQWQVMTKDIDFLAARLSMPRSIISSVYHDGHPSISSTLHAILEFETQGLTLDDHDHDPVMTVHALELGEEFPAIPPLHVFALIRLTHPSTATAHELAKELRPPKLGGSIEIIARAPPIHLSPPTPPGNLDRSSLDATENGALSAVRATALSTQHRQAHLQASARALTAHRRWNSDPSARGGEAAHYSALAREHEVNARRYESLAADAIVLEQSTRDAVDLHGVSVKDAVRIAREQVQAWWDALGEAKLDHRVRENLGYRVIIGQGRHSRDGRSRIGPAVGRMLVREGWKVQFGRGDLVVMGRVRR